MSSMNRIPSHFQEINIIGKLADMKESNYKNTLLLTALVELLIDKGLLTRKEVLSKARNLESDLLNDLSKQINTDL
jgi:hypothetical protein